MCKKTVLWVLGAVLCLAAIPPVSLAQVANLADLNNSFEEEVDFFNGGWEGGWVTWNPVEGNGSTITYDATEFIDGAQSLRVDATGTEAWHFEVIYAQVPMAAGQDYTASVWAKAEEPRTFGMQFKAMDNSTTWGFTSFDLTTEWTEYTITADALNNNNVKVEIHCGGTEIPMWLDFFHVYEGPYVAGLLPSGLSVQAQAHDPNPAAGSTDILRDVELSWTPGEFAQTHDVYFGMVWDDVNAASIDDALGVLVSPGQAATAFDPGRLEFGQTYYWRIDEVNGAPDNAIFKGEVWNFTVEPFAYPIENVTASSDADSSAGEGSENTINGSGLNEQGEHSIAAGDMWLTTGGAEPIWIRYEFDRIYKLHEMLVWNYNVQFERVLGFGVKDVTVEYSVDGVDWTVLSDVELAQGTARADYAANTTVSFGGVPVKYVRLTVNSGWGMMGQFGLSEVRFLYIPAQAREPEPEDNASDISPSTTLAWRAGRDSVSHEIYLSTDEQAVANGSVLVDIITDNSYAASGLEFGSTYYWMINELQDTESWEGPLWKFSTLEFALIEGFEDYDDEDNRIYDTWLDGWVNETGSMVGYLEEPFAERTIVNSGRQSMPLAYDNSAAPFYSEAEYDLGGMNLTGNGADNLRLFVSGLAPGFAENADGTILMNGIGTDIWGTGDQFRYAYKSLSGNGSIVARIDSLDMSPDVWVKAGVMIRQDTGTGSQHSFMPITGSGGNGASWQGRVGQSLDSVNEDNAGELVAAPYWVRIDRSGNNLTGFISPDGETWTQIGDPREVAMNDPVLIGLALTSHNANQATSAQFSNISFTGNVTGTWQVAEIGATQLAGNTPKSVYVALEDSGGSVAVVTHPDSALTARSGWTEWLIPYSELMGVNLNSVATMYIGVGDRDNPISGGTGLIFIDDIGFGRPAE